MQPLRILDERLIQRGNKLIAQVRVAWQRLLEDYSTWEELHALHRLHPTAPAWGHAASQEGGIVTTFLSCEGARQEKRKLKRAKKAKERVARARWAATEDKTQPMTGELASKAVVVENNTV